MTKYNVDTAEGMLRSALMEPRTAGKTVDVEHEKVVIKCLKMVRTNKQLSHLKSEWKWIPSIKLFSHPSPSPHHYSFSSPPAVIGEIFTCITLIFFALC